MLKDLLKRVRYADLIVLICVFILLGFFVIGQESIESNQVTPLTELPDNEIPVDGLPSTVPIENAIQSKVVEEIKQEIKEDFENKEHFYIPLEEIINSSNSEPPIDETETQNVSLGGSNNSENNDSGANSNPEEENLDVKEPEFEYLSIDNLSINQEINDETARIEYADADQIRQTISYSYFDYVDENKKIYEFVAERGKAEEIKDIVDNINRIETVERNEEQWKKEIVLEASKHVNDSFITYEDVEESPELKKESIKLYWKEENKEVDFETYDTDNNGLIDRISWTVPHLSTQTFQIIISLDKINDMVMEGMSLNVLEAPIGNINKTDVYFNFSVSYYDISLLNCNFGILKAHDALDTKNFSESLNYSLNLENGEYSWELNCRDSNDSAIFNSTSGAFNINVNYTPIIGFNSDKNSINKGESVSFSVNITAIVNSNISYIIEYGDGSSGANSNNINMKNLYNNVQHIYNTEGNYTARLRTYIDNSLPYETTRLITVNFNDTEKPAVTLIEPASNELMSIDSFNFSYKVSDNINLSNCTLSIYYYDNSQLGSLVYSHVNTTLNNSQKVKMELRDFDPGNYSWDVGCYDKNSNYKEESRDFEVDFDFDGLVASQNRENIAETLNESFEGREEIDSLIESINKFLLIQEKYSAEEKEAIEDLKINENLEFYKKKLLQMRLDLQHNLDYMRSSESREKRKSEILDEVENMSAGIPQNLVVISAHEYYKNSLDFDFEEIIGAYAASSGIVLDDKSKKNIAEENVRIQKFIIVSAKAKQVEIEYKDKTDKITLVKKKIEVKNDSFDSFIEVIPKEIAESSTEIVFVNKYRVIKEDPIFEIKLEDLEKSSIIYYIKRIVDTKEIEKTTTFSFKENFPAAKISGISGLVTFVSGGEKNVWFYLSWILTLTIFCCMTLFGFKNARIAKWKKNDKVMEIFVLIRKTKKMIKNDIEKSRENYQKAKELYPSLPLNCKRFIYNKIEELRVEIDKKDIAALVKEFISVAKTGNKEEALKLYEKINKVYRRLPKKYQKKVYNKILPIVKELKK